MDIWIYMVKQLGGNWRPTPHALLYALALNQSSLHFFRFFYVGKITLYGNQCNALQGIIMTCDHILNEDYK